MMLNMYFLALCLQRTPQKICIFKPKLPASVPDHLLIQAEGFLNSSFEGPAMTFLQHWLL